MFATDQYELLDFGAGRKLERFGRWILDRPAPAAQDFARRAPATWNQAAARFELGDARTPVSERGAWTNRAELPVAWTIRAGAVVLEVKRTDFGHLGVFPEHARYWQGLAEQVQAGAEALGRPLEVLNLFAYTGGATLALAAAGARVAHVDAARSAVAWARRNAAHSQLETAPVRWIVEDARRFVAREIKRGRRYDAVVLDPPTYGHGPGGQSWKLPDHLPQLIDDLRALTAGGCRFMLLTCHTGGFERTDLAALLSSGRGGGGRLALEPLELASAGGGRLPCGIAARWTP